MVADEAEAAEVRPEVAEGAEDGEGLLEAEEAVEGPLAVELDDGLAGGDAARGDDVLAGVVALAGAVPEEDAVEEGYKEVPLSVLGGWTTARGVGDVRMGVSFPGPQFSVLQTCWLGVAR